jgi:peptidoglycan L-alanyl-D-glutamate endopeptidase CwlK
MTFKLGTRSMQRLDKVHPDLVTVVKRAIEISSVDFTVLEGLRDFKRQQLLVKQGASTTLNSMHLANKDGLSRAVDLGAYVGGSVRWDWPLYYHIAAAMKLAANELGIPIVWGGDWRTFKDGPHFELDRKVYNA